MKNKFKNKYLKLYECCQTVKGYSCSIIEDFQRNSFKFIPNDLINILQTCKTESLSAIYDSLNDNDKLIFEDYIDFILSNEFGFLIDRDELNLFPYISTQWSSPFEISNAIIYVSNITIKYISSILYQIDSLLCTNIQLVILKDYSKEDMNNLLSNFAALSIQSIDISINYNPTFTPKYIIQLINNHPLISQIAFFNSDIIQISDSQIPIHFYKNRLTQFTTCGNINPNLFIIDLSFFTESKNYNTCLNKKLCIDYIGNIKNCPFQKENFGNIKDTTLANAINKDGFTKLWNITKDKIEICKHCEYRYMCNDCRYFIEDPEYIFSKPSKCKYNPYINKWNFEPEYLPIRECGYYNKEKKFIPNKEKIKNLNKSIWDEKF